MPNSIKYNVSTETLALKKGNFWIGTGDVGKGPTSTTGYWNGITPVRGGYTIYLNKASNGPSIYAPSNDAQLIDNTNKIAGTSYTTVNECFNYYAGQSDKMVFNIDYESIVTNGLIMNLDAGFTSSYPRNGTTWYDIATSNNGTLQNGPTFSSTNGGSIVFDGSNDRVDCGTFSVSYLTVSTWVYRTSSATHQGICRKENGWAVSQYNGTLQVAPGTSWTFYNTGYVIPLDTWVNITYTYNGSGGVGSQIVYINGVSIFSSSAGSGAISSNANQVAVGYDDNNWFWGGRIANTLIYNRALTSSEVLNNFRFGGQRAFTGCKTCKEIIDTFPQLAGYDGLYWVYPGGPTSSPYQVHCDMTTDGGGWTLIARSAPSVNLGGENWGWKGGTVGNINDFSKAYQLGWGEIWDGNATFTSFIFGNQRTNVDNSWGPFIYKVSSINYSTFFNSDTQQSYTNSTIKSNTAVYGTSDFPGMQQAVGYTTTGTNNNIYYMRDCCGYAGYGGGWGGMTTVYCGANFYYSGPWCGGETTTGGVYDFNTYTSNGLTYGGTQHYMIMVK
jgi:hypothetical protein